MQHFLLQIYYFLRNYMDIAVFNANFVFQTL